MKKSHFISGLICSKWRECQFNAHVIRVGVAVDSQWTTKTSLHIF